MKFLELHNQLDETSLRNSLNILAIIDGTPDERTDVKYEDSLKEILKMMTCRWLLLDNELKAIMDKAKEYKNEKMQLEKKILDFMNKNDQDEIVVREGKLSKADKESKEPLNEDYIKKCIIEKTNNTTLADELAKIIMENRNKELEQKLKNMTNKVTKAKVAKPRKATGKK